jgi:hypothetical protein
MAKPNYLIGMRVTNQEIDQICKGILGNDEHQTPIVGEDVFVTQIIPLLQRPWDLKNQDIYRRYVKELTMPLRVAGVRNGESIVLFTVPPLLARVDTSMGSIHDITVGHFINHADLIRTRGTNEPVDQYISEFLQMVSMSVPIEHKTLVPIGAILALYDKTFVDDGGFPLYSLDGSTVSTNPTINGVTTVQADPFESEGYLDED